MNKTVEKEADYENLKEGFHQLHERPLREDAAKPVDGIELVQFKLDGLRIKGQPHLKEVDGQSNDHDEEHDRKGGLDEDNNNADEDAQDILRIHRLVQIAEHVGSVGRNRYVDGIPQELETEKSDEQHECAVELLTAGNLPLLACVGALFRRRFLRLFARKTLEVKDESVPIGGLAPQAIYFHTFH